MEEFLRPATANDITIGRTIYLIGDEDIIYQGTIEEVLRPSDPFKAFVAEDGCRYGLEGLYVKAKAA